MVVLDPCPVARCSKRSFLTKSLDFFAAMLHPKGMTAKEVTKMDSKRVKRDEAAKQAAEQVRATIAARLASVRPKAA